MVLFNGREIGRTDEKTINYWCVPRRYRIPLDWVNFGAKNKLTVKMRNLRGEAGFGGTPVLLSGDDGMDAPVRLEVARISYFNKEYRLDRNGVGSGIHLSLGSPFVRFHFEADHVRLELDGKSARYGAYSTKDGVKIIDFAQTDRIDPSDWNAPWLLLFSGDEQYLAPIMLVFEHRLQTLSARRNGKSLVSLNFAGNKTLGKIGAGFLFGAQRIRTDDWRGGLPESVQTQVRDMLPMALTFPVGCEEIFKVDPATGEITVRNVFSYEPIASDWNISPRPFAPLPPLVGFALREKLFVSSAEKLRDSNIRGTHGPILIADGKNTVEWKFQNPDCGELVLPRYSGENTASAYYDNVYEKSVQRTVGGIRWQLFDGARPVGPNWPWYRNLCLFRIFSGVGNGLNSLLLVNPQNRAAMRIRAAKIVDRPLDLWAYKYAGAFREEPFSKVRYQGVIQAQRRLLDTPFAPGTGYGTMTGDTNEATNSMLWIFEQLGNRCGKRDVIRSNWDTIRRASSFSRVMDNYTMLFGSLSDDGIGAWLDMANCEYTGMIHYARCARLAGDREEELQGLYRAARKALPTLCRFRFGPYWNSLNTGESKPRRKVCIGFSLLEPSARDAGWDFQSAHDLWDYSQGMPGALVRLYEKYADEDADRYLREDAMPDLVRDDKIKMRHSYLKVLAYFHKGELPLMQYAKALENRETQVKENDWPGMGIPAEYGAVFYRKYGNVGIVSAFNLNLESAVFDTERRVLELSCEAESDSELAIGTKRETTGIIVNGKPRAGKKWKEEGTFSIPLEQGKNVISILFR